jgi:hypothetical protein
MPKKKKHPKDMTSEEAIKHLFGREGHKHIKKHLAKLNRPATKKG